MLADSARFLRAHSSDEMDLARVPDLSGRYQFWEGKAARGGPQHTSM